MFDWEGRGGENDEIVQFFFFRVHQNSIPPKWRENWEKIDGLMELSIYLLSSSITI